MICANTEDALGRLVGNAPVRTHTPPPTRSLLPFSACTRVASHGVVGVWAA